MRNDTSTGSDQRFEPDRDGLTEFTLQCQMKSPQSQTLRTFAVLHSCHRTVELSRLRRLAKPAIAGRLQRRVWRHDAIGFVPPARMAVTGMRKRPPNLYDDAVFRMAASMASTFSRGCDAITVDKRTVP